MSAQALEGIVEYIIPLYIHVMYKKGSTATIYTTSNRSKHNDEFQIRTNKKKRLPLQEILTGEIVNHVNFTDTVNTKSVMKQSLELTVRIRRRNMNYLLEFFTVT